MNTYLAHGRAHADLSHALGPVGELARLPVGSTEQLDERRSGRREPLGHLAGHRRVVVGRLALEVGEARPHAPGGHDEQGQEQQREERDSATTG